MQITIQLDNTYMQILEAQKATMVFFGSIQTDYWQKVLIMELPGKFLKDNQLEKITA